MKRKISKYLVILYILSIIESTFAINRGDVLNVAYMYKTLDWNVDSLNIANHTDTSATPNPQNGYTYSTPCRYSGFDNGEPMVGMPYRFGGEDTIEEFLDKHINQGYAPGNSYKRSFSGCESWAAGIDCSAS